MTKETYIIKLIPGNKAMKCQNHLGYLWNALEQRIARYTRGEAVVKARIFHAKAEKVKRENFYVPLLLLAATLSSNAHATVTKIPTPLIARYVIDIPHYNAQYVGSHGQQWQRILDSHELDVKTTRAPRFSDLRAVQQAASMFSYKADSMHWKLPSELDRTMQGDCKDVAIWKYKQLKARGWKPENLNLWVVKIEGSKNHTDGQPLQHMFLTARINGEEWLLNSPAFWGEYTVPKPVLISPTYMQAHFEFMYRFNENGATLN